MDKFLTGAWKKGRLKGNQKGKNFMTKEGNNKFILKEDQEKFIKDGWILGMTIKNSIKT